MKIIGHRGCAGLEPENTMRAFRKAMELGVREVELDVHESLDGYLVVIHDDKVGRTTNGKGRVSELTLFQLQKLDAGKGEAIPRLESVLNLFKKSSMIVNLEIKRSGCEQSVVNLIRDFRMEHQTVVISFLPEVLRTVKNLSPRLDIGLIIKRRRKNVLKLAEELKAERILIKHSLATPRLVRTAHLMNFRIIVWTVDNPKDIRKMIALNVDGICSNYPDRVQALS